eukprot:3790906-Pyramimonas_sp.AAC.1
MTAPAGASASSGVFTAPAGRRGRHMLVSVQLEVNFIRWGPSAPSGLLGATPPRVLERVGVRRPSVTLRLRGTTSPRESGRPAVAPASGVAMEEATFAKSVGPPSATGPLARTAVGAASGGAA